MTEAAQLLRCKIYWCGTVENALWITKKKRSAIKQYAWVKDFSYLFENCRDAKFRVSTKGFGLNPRELGYKNLYVADAAILSQTVGRNPSTAIAALAERVAHLMLNCLTHLNY